MSEISQRDSGAQLITEFEFPVKPKPISETLKNLNGHFISAGKLTSGEVILRMGYSARGALDDQYVVSVDSLDLIAWCNRVIGLASTNIGRSK